MNKKYIIVLDVGNGIERFAQNRSKTFDHSITVVNRKDAKRFDSIRQCHNWLKRHGVWKNYPEPFTGWEIQYEDGQIV